MWACFSILISCGQFVVFPHDKQTCYHKSLRTRHIHKRGAFLGRGVIKRTQRVSSSERPKQHHRGPKTEGKKLDSQKQKNLEPVIQRLLKMSNLAIFNPRSLVIAESVILTLQKEYFWNFFYQKKYSTLSIKKNNNKIFLLINEIYHTVIGDPDLIY